MSKIHKIEVVVAEGTGAGYGNPPHLTASGSAVVWARSLKRGVEEANKVANARLYKAWIDQGVMCGCAIPIYGHLIIDGKYIDY